MDIHSYFFSIEFTLNSVEVVLYDEWEFYSESNIFSVMELNNAMFLELTASELLII